MFLEELAKLKNSLEDQRVKCSTPFCLGLSILIYTRPNKAFSKRSPISASSKSHEILFELISYSLYYNVSQSSSYSLKVCFWSVKFPLVLQFYSSSQPALFRATWILSCYKFTIKTNQKQKNNLINLCRD